MELENKSAYPQVCHKILAELSGNLPPHLAYHTLDHTMDVANVCNHYIDYYTLSEPISELLRIAAVAHDFGYIFAPDGHEERSIAEVRPMLSEYGDREIALIEGMIRATKVPQRPKNLYEEILADADLDYLGREDYPELSNRLYTEFLHYGVVADKAQWVAVQIAFLENHNFHTDWAKKHRSGHKAEVLRGLKEERAAIEKSSGKPS